MNLFDEIDKLFLSLSDYLSFNKIILMFILLFLVTAIFVVFATTQSYESKLIKSIDRFNNYFASNPQITEDNLFYFNNMMKSNKVPKQLRKQWQQFVLYRDKSASEYISLDVCVSSPLKNSGHKQAIKVLNILSYVLALLATLFNVYSIYRNVTDLGWFFQRVLITPVLILLLNYLLTLYLEARYNAIVSDIYSNFQYFATNMDKATTTIPEYVDYEVLFDKNEIKRGIPALYAYLQRRAEEEKRELDRARLKNIEHEKFNFDEAGIESSLVLERAMQEAENYIAERKKYLQDVEQINSEISQEEMNFREATKEYQRQMQVSKESFANFKESLENAASTIEANYLKKQQQQELDRQRNLERDYDAANENHKRIMENFQSELTALENEIKKSRTTLEKGMMSEFSTYSNKVYDAAKKLVDERVEEQKQKLKAEIKSLEEKLAAKDQELNNIYAQNQQLNSKIINSGENTNLAELEKQANKRGKAKHLDDDKDKNDGGDNVDKTLFDSQPAKVEENKTELADDVKSVDDTSTFSFNYLDKIPNDTAVQAEENNSGFSFNFEDDNSTKVESNESEQKDDKTDNGFNASALDNTFNYFNNNSVTDKENFNFNVNLTETEEDSDVNTNNVVADNNSNDVVKQEVVVTKPKAKSPGRPRKVVTDVKPTRGRGRPKKSESDAKVKPAVGKRGRPKSTTAATKTTTAKATATGKRGRPKKTTVAAKPSVSTTTRGRGRPKKADSNTDELEKYLKDIEAQIAAESEKLEATKKELENNSTIRRRPRR